MGCQVKFYNAIFAEFNLACEINSMLRVPTNSISKGFNVAGGINLTSKRAFEYFKAMLIISINKI